MSVQDFKVSRSWSFIWEGARWFIEMNSGRAPHTYVISVMSKIGDKPREKKYSATICSRYEPTAHRVFKTVREQVPVPSELQASLVETAGHFTVPFLDDPDKMKDLLILSKEEFLESYSYMTEEEYDETLRIYQIIVDAQEYALTHKFSKNEQKIPEPAVHAHHSKF